MKNIIKYIAGALFLGLAVSACSPDEFAGADQNGLPTVEGVNVNWNVDDELNQITASVPSMQGAYPLWYIHWVNSKGEEQNFYSTLDTLSKQFVDAGDYEVTLRIGNKNGISNAGITKSVHFAKSLVDWTPILSRLCGKSWRIASSEQGHLGCGPSGTDGTSWWSASPNDKKDYGVYDDSISFSNAGVYTYNPGGDGLTYVNKGTTIWPETSGATEDMDVKTAAQTSSYTLSTDMYTPSGETTQVQANYITLADKSLFPYISDDAQYNNPKFRIESITAKKLVLVYDKPDGSIAWHYILTSEPRVKVFEGFDPTSKCNMWKDAKYTNEQYYANGDGWAANPDPIGIEETSKCNYSITLPDASSQQWQAQVKFLTDIATNAATNYDFSVCLTASKDIKGATVKLYKDDNTFYFADRVDLTAGQEYVFYKSDMTGIDIENAGLVFDFGGSEAGTTVDINNVVLKEHGCDDGTVLPTTDEKPKMDWTYDSASNLWKAYDDSKLAPVFWFADANWSQIADPEYSQDGDTHILTMPVATASQWQGQMHFDTDLAASMTDKYNFYCVLNSNQDHPSVTIKLTETDDADGTKHDDNYFFAPTVALTADEDYIFKQTNVSLPKNDAHALSLFFDFGGNAAGTTVKISKIYLEKVK